MCRASPVPLSETRCRRMNVMNRTEKSRTRSGRCEGLLGADGVAIE